jgi:hypothetical protein
MSALLACALLAAAGPPVPSDAAPAKAPAPPPLVSVDRAPDADPLVEETALRIRSELAAAGYGSRLASCAVDPAAGPADCPRGGTLASISVARAGGATSIFVTSKLRSGLELRRQVRVRDQEGGADARLLAVRAVELLRDLQVEVAFALEAQDPEDPKPLEPFAQPPPPGPSPFHLLAGAAVLEVPWSDKPGPDPTLGAVLGLAEQLGPRTLAAVEAAGPFAGTLPIASSDTVPGRFDRRVYQAVGRLALRVGPRSPLDGPFAVLFAGVSYVHLTLNAPNLYGPSGQGFSPLAGAGMGYAARVTSRLSVSAELDVEASRDLVIDSKRDTAGNSTLLAESGFVWVTLNVTAAIRVP